MNFASSFCFNLYPKIVSLNYQNCALEKIIRLNSTKLKLYQLQMLVGSVQYLYSYLENIMNIDIL